MRDTLVWCGIPIIIVLLIRIFLLGFYVIPSGSMMNTIEPGDRVITSKLTPKVFDLKRGDVVVFKDPDHWLRQEDSSKLGVLVRTNMDGEFISLTIDQVYLFQKYLMRHSVTLMADGQKLPCICME